MNDAKKMFKNWVSVYEAINFLKEEHFLDEDEYEEKQRMLFRDIITFVRQEIVS